MYNFCIKNHMNQKHNNMIKKLLISYINYQYHYLVVTLFML